MIPAPKSTAPALLNAYLDSLATAGLYVGPPVVSIARTFLDRVGPAGWSAMSLAEQCALAVKYRRVVGWLLVNCHMPATAEYLVEVQAFLGGVSSRLQPDVFETFRTQAATLGYDRKSIVQQWSAVAKIAALHQCTPAKVTLEQLTGGRDALVAALNAKPGDTSGVVLALTRDVFRAGATMFHAGMIDGLPARQARTFTAVHDQQWATAAPLLARRLRDYVQQVRVSLRPSTVMHIDSTLRTFAMFIADHDPTVTCLAELRRSHIEAFKLHTANRIGATGKPLTRNSIAQQLGVLRTCFERLIEWGDHDVPPGVLVFAGDFPIRDEPLPRFLDDAAATKLLAAARSDPDPFNRLCVEVLARTGMRKGEFLDLTIDAVVQIGSAFWLRVPLGKLHNDRYIPLHPQLKAMFDDWLTDRPADLRSPLMFTWRGRKISKHRVDAAVAKAAADAGINHVTPHQLRHTLATQAINRGMSLEAIAALLGHRSMRMTMVYARIADRTVADEYFAVSEKVEALYNQPRSLPSDAEGNEMLKLRREMHQRMLGNGHCARPVELDCHFESICESCTYFVTTIEFRPTLQRQRDDAEAKGQTGRRKIFDGLLERLDNQAS